MRALRDVVLAEAQEQRALDPRREARAVAGRECLDIRLSRPARRRSVVGRDDVGRSRRCVQPRMVRLARSHRVARVPVGEECLCLRDGSRVRVARVGSVGRHAVLRAVREAERRHAVVGAEQRLRDDRDAAAQRMSHAEERGAGQAVADRCGERAGRTGHRVEVHRVDVRGRRARTDPEMVCCHDRETLRGHVLGEAVAGHSVELPVPAVVGPARPADKDGAGLPGRLVDARGQRHLLLAEWQLYGNVGERFALRRRCHGYTAVTRPPLGLSVAPT